jgi:hypothetical protein
MSAKQPSDVERIKAVIRVLNCQGLLTRVEQALILSNQDNEPTKSN